jgi:hypothetical protein
MYLYYFFRSFGLNIITVNIPTNNVLIYSVAVLFHYQVLVMLIMSFIAIAIALISRFVPSAKMLLAIIVILFLFGAGNIGARHAADDDAQDLRSAPQSYVQFVFKDSAHMPNDLDIAALKNFDPGSYGVPTLLLQTPDEYFVFVDRDTNISQGQFPKLLQIGRSEVLVTKTWNPP